MSSAIDIRIKSLERQIETLKSAIAEPRGLFETIDAMIKNFRLANREMLRSLGFQAQAGSRTRLIELGILHKPTRRRLRQMLRIARR